jgi:hypothetical protein
MVIQSNAIITATSVMATAAVEVIITVAASPMVLP